MTTTRKITSLAVAASVAAGAILPLATAAQARPRHGGDHYVGKKYDGGRAYRYSGPQHYGYVHRKSRRDDTGKAIAIGAGLLMLGIIASQAGRHGYDYDD